MSKVLVGTSGWHYKDWIGGFYPPRFPATQMLGWYSQRFNTVEINNSFYRLPSPETFANWKRSTPKDFCFAVKASRYLTHRKKLKDPHDAIARLLDPVSKLGGKLGPLLFQLPPRWRVNVERLRDFLQALPRKKRCVLEFRDPSWHIPQVFGLLQKYNVALCIYDQAGFRSPVELTADFTYLRFHGPETGYHGSYPDRELQQWASRIDDWRRLLKVTYVYFNNDYHGNAIRNADTLLNFLGSKTTRI